MSRIRVWVSRIHLGVPDSSAGFTTGLTRDLTKTRYFVEFEMHFDRFMALIAVFIISTAFAVPARASQVCGYEKQPAGNWFWVCTTSDGKRTITTAPAGNPPPEDDSIDQAFRGKITYEGYMEGNVSFEERSRTRLRVGDFSIPLANHRNVPVHASYTVDVEYNGNMVNGTERQTSDIPGVSGTGTFRGTRRGSMCDVVSSDGIRVRATCTGDLFVFDMDYVNGQQQHVVAHVEGRQTALVDYLERDRQTAAAQAERQRQEEANAAALAATPLASPALVRALEAAVAQDSSTWAANRYNKGSIHNVHVLRPGANARLRAEYSYNDGKIGWVEADVQAGTVVCLEYWDAFGCNEARKARYADNEGRMHDTVAKANPTDCLNFSKFITTVEVTESCDHYSLLNCRGSRDKSVPRITNICNYPIAVVIDDGWGKLNRTISPGKSIDGVAFSTVTSVERVK